MALFKRGAKRSSKANRKPVTDAVPEGGYGSYGAPSKANSPLPAKNKPGGGHGSYGKAGVARPMGSYGSHGKPTKQTSSTPMRGNRDYASDGMAEPKTPIPKDQKTGRFNLPKGKFTY